MKSVNGKNKALPTVCSIGQSRGQKASILSSFLLFRMLLLGRSPVLRLPGEDLYSTEAQVLPNTQGQT